MKEIGKQEMDDMLVGSAILGTGGGGSLERARKNVKKDFDRGEKFELVSLDELDDEEMLASPYFCGSLTPEDDEKEKGVAHTYNAVDVLEQHLGKKFSAMIATEIGAGNLAIAFSTAVKCGVPLVDADPAGRSVPELSHTTFHVYDVPIDPIGVSDGKNRVLIEDVEDDFVAEKIARSIAVSLGGTAGVCDHPGTAKDMRGTLIEDSVTKSLEIGKKRRQAIENGVDPVEKITEGSDGAKLFEGEITDYQWEEKSGFTVGEVLIENEEEDEMKIWFKNEHLMSWVNDEAYVTAPDLISIVTKDEAKPILNPNVKKGQSVAVLGFKADNKWRSDKGLEVLSPKYFDFDIEYTPMEEII
ncbi:MAG: DUF917 domain-containing protein [Candidatus Natronoplasma sp.]